MQSDTAHPDEHRDPQDSTAVIHPVTDAMMDHAAHEAAELADGVARGTVPPARTEPAVGADEAPAAASEASPVPEPADDASGPAAQFTGAVAEGASRAMEQVAEAARDGLPAPAGALGQYNAKVVEMMRANMASTTALFAALVQAKSVPEALALNADHLRRQMDTLTTQGRELAALAQRIAFDALQPFKNPADR